MLFVIQLLYTAVTVVLVSLFHVVSSFKLY